METRFSLRVGYSSQYYSIIKRNVLIILHWSIETITIIFCFLWPGTGGSISNMYAFLAARHKMFPGYKEQGLHSIKGQLVMYTSNQVRTRSVSREVYLFQCFLDSCQSSDLDVHYFWIGIFFFFISSGLNLFRRWQNRSARLLWRGTSVSPAA